MIHGQNGTSNQLRQTPLGNLFLDSSVVWIKPAYETIYCGTFLPLCHASASRLSVGTTFTALAQWLERSRTSTVR